jgi:hypothetical protein
MGSLGAPSDSQRQTTKNKPKKSSAFSRMQRRFDLRRETFGLRKGVIPEPSFRRREGSREQTGKPSDEPRS